MTPEEAATLQAKMAAYDRRTVGKSDSAAWADAMTRAGINLPDALEAVSLHFQDSHDWLMPDHIVKLVKAIRRARVATADQPVPPAELADDQVRERAWLATYWGAVKINAADPQLFTDRLLGITRDDDPQIENPGVMGRLKSLTWGVR